MSATGLKAKANLIIRFKGKGEFDSILTAIPLLTHLVIMPNEDFNLLFCPKDFGSSDFPSLLV